MSVKPKFYTYAETAERLGQTLVELGRFIAYPPDNRSLRAFVDFVPFIEAWRPLTYPLSTEPPSPDEAFNDCILANNYGSVTGHGRQEGEESDRRCYMLSGIFELVDHSKRIRDHECLLVKLVSNAEAKFRTIFIAPDEWLFLGEQVEQFATDSEQRMPGKWPWGSYETKLLHHLAEAARQWWSTYDPEQPATAPRNDQVSQWLIDRDVPSRMAETMATMLRADGLRRGPR